MAPDFERLAGCHDRCLLAIVGHKAPQLGLGLFMFKMSGPGPHKDGGQLCPGIGRTHVDNAHRFDARPRRLDAEQGRGLATLDAAPEFPLGRNEQVLIERVGMGLYFNPLAAAGDDRKCRTSCCRDPHIVLQLRHVFFGGRFFRERPRQHELSLEDRAAGHNTPVKGCRHPAQRRLPDMPLNIGDDFPGLGLVPAAVQLLGDNSELDSEVAGQILRLDLGAFFPP